MSNVTKRKFSEVMPSFGDYFCFVDPTPDEPDRWLIGWRTVHEIVIEGMDNIPIDDPNLTDWYPLPEIPKICD